MKCSESNISNPVRSGFVSWVWTSDEWDEESQGLYTWWSVHARILVCEEVREGCDWMSGLASRRLAPAPRWEDYDSAFFIRAPSCRSPSTIIR